VDGILTISFVTISDNIINCDPYRQNPNSNDNGTYIDGTGPTGITSIWGRGLKVNNNVFKNACQAIACFAVGNSIYNNTAHCGTPTGFYFNAANSGIVTILDNGEISNYIIENSNPTSGSSYLQVSSSMRVAASSMPTSGWFVRGHFVKNFAPSLDANNMAISGWLRATSGSNHVAGVDWITARVSNVSPAT
jgi:hypothetical protein